MTSAEYAIVRCKQPSGESFLLRVVVPGVWCLTASASPFLTGHGLVVRTLGIIAGGRVALRLWSLRSKLGSSRWSNSLKTDYHPAASARTHVLMFPPYKNINYVWYSNGTMLFCRCVILGKLRARDKWDAVINMSCETQISTIRCLCVATLVVISLILEISLVPK